MNFRYASLASTALCLSLVIAGSASAKTVQWASKVISYSSQYSDSKSSAAQALGAPNVLPTGGESTLAWAVAQADEEGHESTDPAYLKLGFDHPMQICQVGIGENNAPGAIERVVLLDDNGREHEIYHSTPQGIDEPARMFDIFFPMTPYRVKGVAIMLQPGAVGGWNEIDAIGISDSRDSITARINLVPNLHFTSKPENLGPHVNSAASDLIDAISPDGRTLYVSRQGHPGNVGGVNGKRDVWFCTLQADGTWSEAVNIGAPINNDGNNYVNSVTPDGNSLLLGNTYRPDGSPKGAGVSMTHRTATGWSIPEDVDMPEYYNNADHAEFALSADEKVILMTAQRNDGLGANDIYASFAERNGKWSKPMNLGPDVNTVGDETGPFLAADGVTLYYSTNGKSGYGGNDIFMTRRLDDTWKHWSEPQNLGPVINTSNFDAYYMLAAAGDYAYFSSASNSLGQEDVFRIALPGAARPKPVVLVHGKVFNAKTKQPIEAAIRYEILPGGREAGTARSNPANGDYKIVLPTGSNFGFRAEATGYYAVSENLNTKSIKEYTEIEKDLYLAPIEVGSTIRLNNIFFDFGKSNLQTESYPELDRVADFLKANPRIKIEVSGHTDNVGTDADNRNLSQERANAVVSYLRTKGIATTQMSAKGYGKTRPVATNDTDEGRQQNRRVEFTILND